MKILIATPSHHGDVCCQYCLGMADTFLYAKENNIDLHLNFMMYQTLIQISRNNLFATAYKENYDEIVFIDSDQGFSSAAFYNLLSHDVDVVAYPVRMKTEEERYNIRPEDTSCHNYIDELKLIDVPAIGTGFMRIRRKAIEYLWNNSEPYNNNEDRMICNIKILNGNLVSEDLDICNKLKKGGFSVYVDPSFTCDHFGIKKFSGNYMRHYLMSEVYRRT